MADIKVLLHQIITHSHINPNQCNPTVMEQGVNRGGGGGGVGVGVGGCGWGCV